jgi:acid stress-induced BolA-like protein IbaG/YrbA
MGEDVNNAPFSNGSGHHESVRRVSTQFADVMSVANRGAKRSNLLPRMSAANVDALQREIYTLQHEIDRVLPTGHEANKHVRHLLDKAQTILQHDPTHSAEVEYYLQQVRTIFPRVQQTIDWSSLYRNRLTLYLGAWVLLALLVVVARYLYQAPIETFVEAFAGLAADSLMLQHFNTLLATFFAGALGGALGALVNLQRQRHMPHGFIDRKFGLRGLILPLMGAIVGLLLYLPLGLLFFVFALNPAQNLLFSTVPVLLAFLFGISQESLYGTRE